MEKLTEEQLSELGKRWAQDALAEHASIASFSRLSLQLLKYAAPPGILLGANSASVDEVRHAKAAFDLANTYKHAAASRKASSTVGDGAAAAAVPVKSYRPGPFPLDADSIQMDITLQELAAAAVIEGCIGETLAVFGLIESAAHCDVFGPRSTLAMLIRDECNHAVYAWRLVRWLLRSAASANGLTPEKEGAAVQEAVQAAFQGEFRSLFAISTPPVPSTSSELLTSPLSLAECLFPSQASSASEQKILPPPGCGAEQWTLAWGRLPTAASSFLSGDAARTFLAPLCEMLLLRPQEPASSPVPPTPSSEGSESATAHAATVPESSPAAKLINQMHESARVSMQGKWRGLPAMLKVVNSIVAAILDSSAVATLYDNWTLQGKE
jgi:hypothetical protein